MPKKFKQFHKLENKGFRRNDNRRSTISQRVVLLFSVVWVKRLISLSGLELKSLVTTVLDQRQIVTLLGCKTAVLRVAGLAFRMCKSNWLFHKTMDCILN